MLQNTSKTPPRKSHFGRLLTALSKIKTHTHLAKFIDKHIPIKTGPVTFFKSNEKEVS